MLEEVVAEVPLTASDPVVTVTPEPVVETPEVVVPKTFTQEELDTAISKRLAREQRKWEREKVQPVAPIEPVSADQFASVDDFAEALAQQKAERIVADRDTRKQQSEIVDSYHEREEEARGKYADFEQVAYNPNLKITDVMAQTIQSSDVGPDLVYYLGMNPKEADRISRLAPFIQAKEIGKLEAKLASDPPVKKTTSAPTPISPVIPKGGNSQVYDTTDPRSIASMTTSQWIDADRARQRKVMEARNR